MYFFEMQIWTSPFPRNKEQSKSYELADKCIEIYINYDSGCQTKFLYLEYN